MRLSPPKFDNVVDIVLVTLLLCGIFLLVFLYAVIVMMETVLRILLLLPVWALTGGYSTLSRHYTLGYEKDD